MRYSVIIVLLGWFISSCDRPECNNENPVFAQYQPNSELYKAELSKQLKLRDQKELRYWLQKYQVENKEEFLYFYVQGDGLCAIIQMTMDHWVKLERLRERKGVGRRGAEFTKLQFKVEQDSTSTTFTYQTFDRIID